MPTLVRISKILLSAMIAGLVVGLLGLLAGALVKHVVVPHPNPHLFEGAEYVALGCQAGILVGFVGGMFIAVRHTGSHANWLPKTQD